MATCLEWNEHLSQTLQSVTKIKHLKFVNLVTPKGGTEHEHFFNNTFTALKGLFVEQLSQT
jgi:hypothetical protein